MRHSAQHLGERRAAVRTPARRPSRAPEGRRRATRTERGSRRLARRRSVAALVAAVAVGGLLATVALAPLPRPSVALADAAAGSVSPFRGEVQEVAVPGDLSVAGVSRERYITATGPETLVASGTNYDWAKLVLVFGDWPVTDENVRFMVEWMREENGPDNWWNRNNPLNNGYGSGGGSGLGSYTTLVDAARYAASNLQKRTFYADIVAALEAGTSADAAARAVWASPWAESHYGYGTWWSTSPVPVVPAPPSAWGR
ncbi:hypothetical protein [Agromyces sp. C10]|uniref:hypothetical protein n=1 Tax=Agromyces sp. C10 TaxID=2935077 RepID=UPI00200A0AD0|nr:hypothetical protein [Agromyces sp. C10]MCK8609618.1 hypothetical protein [Agromyces sp. C10]